MSLFERIWNWLIQFFNASEQSIVAGFQAGISNVAAQLGPDGWKIVQDAVTAANSVSGSGVDKFAAAYATIEADFKKLGIDLVVNTVKLAIEAAVAEFRAKQAAIPDSPKPTE